MALSAAEPDPVGASTSTIRKAACETLQFGINDEVHHFERHDADQALLAHLTAFIVTTTAVCPEEVLRMTAEQNNPRFFRYLRCSRPGL
jgi:hypothetical protein